MPADFKIRIPESAVHELDEVEKMGWGDGLGLPDLISWINQIAERFRPDSIDESARSSAEFSPRSFRHYQTMGCIDAPKRAGKSVVYGFKHYLQGLVIRKLLWEKMSSEQIASLMAGKDTRELKRLLLDGIEIVAAGGSEKADFPPTDGGTWKRIVLAPGVELHLESSSRRALSKQEVEGILGKMREFL
jgi:DNA-binding transcriptional MerR regulator